MTITIRTYTSPTESTVRVVDIADFDAKQRRVSINSHNSIKNDSEWVQGAVLPYLASNDIGMETLTVSLWVYGETREAIAEKCSNILALLLQPVELTLDGWSHRFHGTLKSCKHDETAVDRWHVMTLTFDGYEFGTEVTASGSSAVTVNNPGNVESPCKVVITPSQAISVITIHGLCRDSFTGEDLPIEIANLVRGKAVTIDAITGAVVDSDGNPKKMNLWRYPSVPPGRSSVTCDSAYATLDITVRPLYI